MIDPFDNYEDFDEFDDYLDWEQAVIARAYLDFGELTTESINAAARRTPPFYWEQARKNEG